MASITRKISEGTFFVLFQKVLTIIFGFLSTVLLLKVLGTYQYGLIVLTLSIISVFNVFLDFGIGGVLVSDVAGYIGEKNLGKAKKILKDYAVFQIITGVILSVAAFILSYFGRNYYGGGISNLVRLSSGIIFLNGIKNIFITVFNGFSKFNLFALYNFFEGLFKLLFIFILITVLKGGLNLIILSYFLSLLLALVFSLPWLIKSLKILKNVQDSEEKLFSDLLKGHGKWQVFARPLNNLSDPLRTWIIQYFSGLDSVALYQVALKIYSYLSQIIYSIETPLFPIISEELKKDRLRAKKIFERISKYFFWISILVMILGVIFIPYALRLFFGNKYDGSVPLLKWLLLTFLVGGTALLLRPVLFALKAQKEMLKADSLSFAVGYPVSSYLTYLYGPVGFSIPIGSYISFFLRYYYLKKIDPDFSFKIRAFLKWDKEDLYLLRRIYGAFFSKIKKIRHIA